MLSLVARGQYQFTDYVRLIGEVGGFYQKDSYNNGTSYKQAGEKYTIALGLADGPDFMSRPELRIFASYLNDSEDGKPFEDQTANNTRISACRLRPGGNCARLRLIRYFYLLL